MFQLWFPVLDPLEDQNLFRLVGWKENKPPAIFVMLPLISLQIVWKLSIRGDDGALGWCMPSEVETMQEIVCQRPGRRLLQQIVKTRNAHIVAEDGLRGGLREQLPQARRPSNNPHR